MWWGFLELLVFPPGGALMMMLAGLIWWRRPSARALAAAGMVLLYLASTPSVSSRLTMGLQDVPVLAIEAHGMPDAGAIVVLAGGSNPQAPEYGGATVSASTLERLRYAARVQRDTGLPLLVTGGDPARVGIAEAALMENALTRDFGANVAWVEDRSRNTEENAIYSRELLKAAAIDNIILVTSALHMHRAMDSFRRAGFESVTPAPTGFIPEHPRGFHVWLPDARSLRITRTTLHEYVGRLWYGIRYGG